MKKIVPGLVISLSDLLSVFDCIMQLVVTDNSLVVNQILTF